MSQGENKEVVKYNKSNKYSDWYDKTLRVYKYNQKVGDKIITINMFSNEAKIDVKTALEVNRECGIISTFKVKKIKRLKNAK